MKDNSEKLIEELPRRRMRVFGMAASYTVGNVIVFGGLGYLLDQYLDKSPIFMIAGVVISYPLTQYLLYKRVKKM